MACAFPSLKHQIVRSHDPSDIVIECRGSQSTEQAEGPSVLHHTRQAASHGHHLILHVRGNHMFQERNSWVRQHDGVVPMLDMHKVPAPLQPCLGIFVELCGQCFTTLVTPWPPADLVHVCRCC